LLDDIDEAVGPKTALRVPEILYSLALSLDALSLSDLSDRLSLPKSSLFGLLRALEKSGYVATEGGHYRLGGRALRLGAAISGSRQYPSAVRRHLEQLGLDSRETCVLARYVPEAKTVIYFDVIEASHPLRFSVKIGDTVPMFASAPGQVVLAYLPDAVRAEYLASMKFEPLASGTVTPEQLPERLRSIADTGVCVNRSGRFEGVTGFAAPVFDAEGRIHAAVALGVPGSRATNVRRLTEMVAQAGLNLSHALGFQGNYPPSRALPAKAQQRAAPALKRKA
jgi:DNA-binding IclR family transcriptional regulator